MPAVEPADRASASTAQQRAALSCRLELPVEPGRAPTVDAIQRVAARNDDDVRRRARLLHLDSGAVSRERRLEVSHAAARRGEELGLVLARLCFLVRRGPDVEHV